MNAELKARVHEVELIVGKRAHYKDARVQGYRLKFFDYDNKINSARILAVQNLPYVKKVVDHRGEGFHYFHDSDYIAVTISSI
jgi:hypothetical protein